MILKTELKPSGESARSEEEQHLYRPDALLTEADMQHFRRVAFIAVALSTVTMLSCIILMPISYQHVQRVQSTMLNDMEFCKVSFS